MSLKQKVLLKVSLPVFGPFPGFLGSRHVGAASVLLQIHGSVRKVRLFLKRLQHGGEVRWAVCIALPCAARLLDRNNHGLRLPEAYILRTLRQAASGLCRHDRNPKRAFSLRSIDDRSLPGAWRDACAISGQWSVRPKRPRMVTGKPATFKVKHYLDSNLFAYQRFNQKRRPLFQLPF